MYLAKEEEKMLDGEYGEATSYAMRILVKLGEAHDAERLVDAKSAHVAGGLFIEEIEWYQKLLAGGAKFRCFTTLHPWGVDYDHWDEVGTILGREEWIKQVLDELMKLRVRMGAIPLGTCIQYLLGDFLMRGDYFSWTGSAGVVFANSILGARGNMDGIVTNYAVAITGKVPECGLHLTENRKANIVVKLEMDFKELSDADIGALSYHLGRVLEDRIPVFVNLPEKIELEKLRALASPLHVSGAVPMFHAVGITPEARSVEDALQGDKAEDKITVGWDEVREVYEEFQCEKVDLVAIGCPHCTYNEVKKIAEMVDGKKLKVKLWVNTSPQVKLVANRAGWTEKIEKAGGLLTSNLCLGPGASFAACGYGCVMTNSPRCAYYAPNVKAKLASLEDCIRFAVEGC